MGAKHMPSGGARPGNGRPPDPNALRRDRKDDPSWWTLPSAERTEAAPKWPLAILTDREREVWDAMWRKPIAAVWVRDQQVEQVALYVRTFVESEAIDCSPARRTLLQRMAGELLLTIPAMHSARVKIAADELAARREEHDSAPQPSSKDRMRVVSRGEGA